MFWADELAARVTGPQVVNDSKTPSGTVHVGSLRGPVLLDVIVRALRDRGISTELRYGVDDLDPMDAQALLTPDAIERSMGVPLAHVPDPAGDGHASYARHFSELFTATFAGLGIHPDVYYWMSEVYGSGQMDPFIRTALDSAETVRAIYRQVSHVERPDGWLPVHAICPVCGRVGTTLATDWDGADGRLCVSAGSRRLGPWLWQLRPDRAIWRDREAPMEPRVGCAVEPVRGDHRAMREGSRNGGRVPGSIRRDCPRGLPP